MTAARRFFALACTSAAFALPACERPDRPFDVVLIVIDTLRADRTPLNAPGIDTMPFLAELSGRSVVFERAYSGSSWTAPATASIFTSRYPNQHGVWDGFRFTRNRGAPLNRIPEEIETLPEMMARQGFRTFGVADNINIGERIGFARGFESFEPFEYESASRVSEAVRARAEALGSGRYFLYLHYMDPHMPYHERAPWLVQGRSRGHVAALASTESVTAKQLRFAGEKLDAYDSELGFLDQQLRELYDEFGWERDTLLIVTVDHGEEFYDHGQIGHRFTVYDELVKVPLLISLPGGGPARRIRQPVSTLDLLPTLRELVGAESHPGDAGRSLVPLLVGSEPVEEASEPMPIFSMRLRDEGDAGTRSASAVVLGGWKYIRNLPSGEEELYDLDADPAERRNLAAARTQVAARLRSRLEAFDEKETLSERSFAAPSTLTEDEADHLRELGYVE